MILAYIPLAIMIFVFLVAVYCMIERYKSINWLVIMFLPQYHLVKNRKKTKRKAAKKMEIRKEGKIFP